MRNLSPLCPSVPPSLSPSPTVCILTTVHQADDARILHREAQTLREAGYSVTLLAPGTGRLAVPRNRLLRMTLGLLIALFAALRQRAAVYHLHDPELLPVGLALKALGKRVIYDVHEDYPEQMLSKHYLPRPIRRTVMRLVGAVEKRIAARLDGVVCATETIAGNFRSKRAIVVRNYPRVDNGERRLEVGQSAASRTRCHLVGATSRSRLCPFRIVHFSGTLTPERGITNIVRALDLLDDRFQLILAGQFVTRRYESLIKAEPGFSRVRYIGTIPHRQVWDWYRRADAGLVCLLPLRRYEESLPVKLFEFMAAGLPVIVSDFARLRPIVAGRRCGFCVNPGRPEEIAAAAMWLANDRTLAVEMGENGRRAVETQFNWHKEGERLITLYRDVLRTETSNGRRVTSAESKTAGPLAARQVSGVATRV